jgi:hypothetical protein
MGKLLYKDYIFCHFQKFILPVLKATFKQFSFFVLELFSTCYQLPVLYYLSCFLAFFILYSLLNRKKREAFKPLSFVYRWFFVL